MKISHETRRMYSGLFSLFVGIFCIVASLITPGAVAKIINGFLAGANLMFAFVNLRPSVQCWLGPFIARWYSKFL